MHLFKIKRLLTVFALSVFVVSSAFNPQIASAQTTVSQYKPVSVNELIAYLYGIIASLEAQKTTRIINSYSSLNTDVNGADVETLSAISIKRNSATVRSNIDFGSASYAYAYFEYGTRNSVDETTDEEKVNKTSRDTYSELLDGLRTNTTYYYRAVIELPSGVKIYGSLRNFTTGRTTSSSNNYGDADISTDDSEYNTGDKITVSYEFSDDRESGSWIGLYEDGSSDNEYLSWKYLSDDEGEVSFSAPRNAGDFEFRLFKDSGYKEVATTDVFEVN